MKKKVLFVIPTLRFGGAEKSLITLLKVLDPEKVDMTLLLFEDGGPLQKEVPEYVRIQSADIITRAMILEFRYYFKDLIKSLHWKAVFSRLNMTFRAKYSKKSRFNWETISKYIPQVQDKFDVAVGYLEGATDFFVLDKVTADKKIGWIHIDFSKRDILPEEIDYYCRFDELVTISEVCRNVLTQLFSGKEIHVLENIVSKEDIIQQSLEDVPWDTNIYHFVTVGRLEYQKGMDFAVEAAKILSEKGIHFQWHVFGQGSLHDDVQRLVEQNRLQNYFILEGVTDNPYPYMKRADILVQPSRWEGKSIVLDEAKLLGKAIVVTNYPSVSDQIEDGKTGLIAEIAPASIAEKIMELVQNPDLRKTLERNCENEENKSMRTLDKFYELIDCEE